MLHTDITVIGGGPSGLCAAIEAAALGAKVLLIERSDILGGQLNKQTHKFFGSKKQYAATRGIDIAKILIDEVDKNFNITVWKDSTVLGLYEDGVLTVEHQNKYEKVCPKSIVIGTGASEKFLAFENNDLPGIYGAGAVQTLMNSYGVMPAKEVVMVGAGNIGLIVSYQLMQAGVKVKAIVCTGPVIGGYLVHASKLRRMGVPILTQTTVDKANGTDFLTSVTLVKVDDKRNKIDGTQFDIECDNLCISAGLTPMTELLWHANCKMKYVAALGGYVPMRGKLLQTSVKNVFVAGDAAGVEEASSAMVEGRIAGISAAKEAGYDISSACDRLNDYVGQLEALRGGEHGVKIREGVAAAQI